MKPEERQTSERGAMPSLERLRDAVIEAVTNSEVCRALDALSESGWSPSVSVDITLEPIPHKSGQPPTKGTGSAIGSRSWSSCILWGSPVRRLQSRSSLRSRDLRSS